MAYMEREGFTMFNKYLRDGEIAVLLLFFIISVMYIGVSLYFFYTSTAGSFATGFFGVYAFFGYVALFLMFLIIFLITLWSTSVEIDENSLESEDTIRAIERRRKIVISLIVFSFIGIIVVISNSLS